MKDQNRLTREQESSFRKAIDGGAQFFFIPSLALKDAITRGEDPILSQVPDNLKGAILMCQGDSGVWLWHGMIRKILNNELDKRNAYLLNMGEIRVIGVGDMVIRPDELKRND